VTYSSDVSVAFLLSASERRDARVADIVVVQAAARRGGSEMLVARQGRRRKAERVRLT
jgi:hypothetical protein